MLLVRPILPLVLGLALVASVPAAAVTHHWPGDGTPGDVVGGTDAVLNGGVDYAPAVKGLGFRLDGTGHLSFPATHFRDGATVAMWVKITAAAPRPHSLINNPDHPWGAGIGSDGGFGFSHYMSSLHRGHSISIRGGIYLLDGQFHHLAFTTDQENRTIAGFLDGWKISSYTETDPGFGGWDFADSGETVIGGGLYPLIGIIDDIVLSDRVLSDAEIAALAERPTSDSVCQIRSDADGDCALDAVGEYACIKGIVVAWDEFATDLWFGQMPSVVDPVSGCAIGIDYESRDIPTGPMVQVCGWTNQINGLDVLGPNPFFTATRPAVTVLDPEPREVPFTPVVARDLATGSPTAEALESSLVRLCGQFVETGRFHSTTRSYSFVDLDGDVVSILIDRDTNIGRTPIPDGYVTVFGVVNQARGLYGACGGYRVMPRSLADLAAPVCEVDFVLNPGSCENPLNTSKRGVIPAAILGSGTLDIDDIDRETLELNGVPALRTSTEDVAGPLSGAPCDCHESGPDGLPDLTAKFPGPDVIETLIDPEWGDVLELTLTGRFKDGTPFVGADCASIRKPGKTPGDLHELVLKPMPGGGVQQRVDYTLPQAAKVRLTVFDAAGRVVASLVNGEQPARTHTVEWSTPALPNGVYFYRLHAGEQVVTRKFIILR